MIAVTGGAGFIGSNIIKGLNDAGEAETVSYTHLTLPTKA